MMDQAEGSEQEAISETSPRVIAIAMLESKLAEEGEIARLGVSGACMAPLIEDGDTVLVRGVIGTPPNGTIVVARNLEGQLVCHRFLGCADGTTGLLAAENSLSADLVPLKSIVGIVTNVCREDNSLDLLAGPWLMADKTLGYHHRLLSTAWPVKPIWIQWILTAAAEIRRVVAHLLARLRWRLGACRA